MSVGGNTTHSFGSVLANVNVEGFLSFNSFNSDALNATVVLPNVLHRESRSSGPPRVSDQVRIETSTLPYGQKEVSVRFEDQRHSMAINPRITAGLNDEEAQERLQAASEALSRRVLAQTEERIQNQIMSAILSSSESPSRSRPAAPRRVDRNGNTVGMANLPVAPEMTEVVQAAMRSENEFFRAQILGMPFVSTESEEERANLVRRRIEEAQEAAQSRPATTSSPTFQELLRQLGRYAQERVAQPTIPIPAAQAKPMVPAKPATPPRKPVCRGRMPVLIEDGEYEEAP